MKSAARRDINFTEGRLLKNILFFAIPLIFNGVFQLLFNTADIVVVGKFAGSDQLAAVGSTSSAVNLIVNLCIGLSVGANVLVAQHIGAKENDRIGAAVHTSITAGILFGLITGIAGFFICAPLLKALDTPAEILPSAVNYLKAYFIGVPANIVYNFAAAILRAKGDTTRPLVFLIVSGIVNVLLNLWLVIGLKLGAMGVGIATAASQFAAMALVIACLCREEGLIKLNLKSLGFDKEEMRQIVSIGLPAGLQSSLFSFSNIMVQASINSFGPLVVAGNSAASNLEGFVYLAISAVYQTTLTMTGQNMGARNFDRIDKGIATCAAVVSVITIVLGGLVFIFGTQLLSIYTDDPLVIDAGLRRLPYIALPYFVCGVMEVISGGVRGSGYSNLPLWVTIFGTCIFRIVWILTIFKLINTVESIYIIYIISWIITGSAHFICYLFVRKRVREKYRLGEIY